MKSHIDNVPTASDASTIAQDLSELCDLSIWTKCNPPEGGWRSDDNVVVYVQPHVRLMIKIETAEQIGYGLGRDEDLAKRGIYGAEHDGKNFSTSLLDAIEGKLCIQDLINLKDEVSKRLDEAESNRKKHASVSNTGDEKKFTPAMRKEAEKAWSELQMDRLSAKEAFIKGHMISLLGILETLQMNSSKED